MEVLKAVVLYRRECDSRDTIKEVLCIPADECTRMEAELAEAKANGHLIMVQIGKAYIDIAPHTPCDNQVEDFLDSVYDDEPM